MLFGVVYNCINCGGRLRTTPRRSLMRRVLFLLSKDTFNKLGYKAKINTHTTSCINLFLDIYLYSEYRLIYC